MTLEFDDFLISFKHNNLHDSSYLSARPICFFGRTKNKNPFWCDITKNMSVLNKVQMDLKDIFYIISETRYFQHVK